MVLAAPIEVSGRNWGSEIAGKARSVLGSGGGERKDSYGSGKCQAGLVHEAEAY